VITTKVKSAIVNDSTLKVNEINLETFKGGGPQGPVREWA
jgi:osmotically-inducible protein OsmY